jgi:hypothetical protein
MTGSVSILGLADYENETVTVFLAGLDCGEIIVQNAKAVIPYGSDPDGLLSYRYLGQVTAYIKNAGITIAPELLLPIEGGHFIVPCVVGYRYRSRGKRLPPIAPDESGAQQGPAFAKLRRNNRAGFLLHNTFGLSIGTDFSRMHKADLRSPGWKESLSPTELFSGMFEGPIEDTSSFEGTLAWEITGPYPAHILATGGFLETEDK